MNNQLLLGVLLVLSWGFMGASAQASNSTSNGTVASSSTIGPNTTMSLSTNASVASAGSTISTNATTPTASGTPNTSVTNQPASNATASNGTTSNAASNVTASNVASNPTTSNGTASNATTSNATASNGTASNATTSNATASNGTTSNAASNVTASNATTSNATASNATTSNVTASNVTASNATTSNATTTNTTTAPVTTPFPVAALQTPITKTSCGSSKLCASAPSSCDPSTGIGCYFISAQQQSGQLYNFELSGQTDGYVAAGVSTASNQNGTNQAYICLNNNSAVNFFTGTITNLLLSLTQLSASNVKGSVSSNKIQCTFAAMLPDTTRSAAYSLSVSTGTYNSSTGTFGSPSFKIFTNQVNLSDPTSNVTNQISGAYPVTYQQPLIPALLVTVVMLTFSAL